MMVVVLVGVQGSMVLLYNYAIGPVTWSATNRGSQLHKAWGQNAWGFPTLKPQGFLTILMKPCTITPQS